MGEFIMVLVNYSFEHGRIEYDTGEFIMVLLTTVLNMAE